MKSNYSMTTRGAAFSAPRRFFSLLLALIILLSFACPALAADSKIDISNDGNGNMRSLYSSMIGFSGVNMPKNGIRVTTIV